MIGYIIALLVSCIALALGSYDAQPPKQELSTATNIKVLKGEASTGVSYAYDDKDALMDSYAKNMVTYSNAVTAYAKANPSYTGVVPSGSITLPSWYLNKGWVNYMANGYVYVYTNTSTLLNVPGIGLALNRITNAYALAGEAKSGGFHHVSSGLNSSITFPVAASIPNGSPVLITNVDYAAPPAFTPFLTITTTGTSQRTDNLTTVGTLDWASYGEGLLSPYRRKATGGSLFSNLTKIGGGSGPNFYPDSNHHVTWSDATPAPSSPAGNDGRYGTWFNEGYSFTVPAMSVSRKLRIYMDSYNGTMRVEASLGDGSAPPVSHTFAEANPYFPRYIEIDYGSNSNTLLTVSVTRVTDLGGGNVTIVGAALSNN